MMMSTLRSARFTRTWGLVLALTITATAGCASSVPPPPPAPTAAFPEVRRVVVVPSGDSQFAVVPTATDAGRVFDDLFKWLPHKRILISIARLVYQGVTDLIEPGRPVGTAPRDVTPGLVVAAAFTQALRSRGSFEHVAAMEREPVGDARREADAIVRLAVPSWGLVRVREGEPPLVSGFADVRVQMVRPDSGVVLWDHAEDVTHPDRRFLDALAKDRALTRESLIEVLERAGQRVASELVYAQRRGP